jgi:hypothetical protein
VALREVVEALREAASMAQYRGRQGWGRRRGSGTTTGPLLAASRPKEGSVMGWRNRVRDGATRSGMATGVRDDDGGTVGGVEAEGGDGMTSREATEAAREATSMARHRGRRQRRGRETWAA